MMQNKRKSKIDGYVKYKLYKENYYIRSMIMCFIRFTRCEWGLTGNKFPKQLPGPENGLFYSTFIQLTYWSP